MATKTDVSIPKTDSSKVESKVDPKLSPTSIEKDKESTKATLSPVEPKDIPNATGKGQPVGESFTGTPANPSDVMQPKPVSKYNPDDIANAIHGQDLDYLNSHLEGLRFCIQRDVLIPITQILKVHEDGRLDLTTSPYEVPVPKGTNIPSRNQPLNGFYPKVRREDFLHEAGTYRVLPAKE